MKNFIILTPVYNDWENLNKLLKKINVEAERNNFEFEIFVVNDSSTINANTLRLGNFDSFTYWSTDGSSFSLGDVDNFTVDNRELLTEDK